MCFGGLTHTLFLPSNAKQANRALLVVAEDVESDPLAMLILNKHRAGLKVIALLELTV